MTKSGNPGDEVGGGKAGNLEHAVSASGDRVYWSSAIAGGAGRLYLRENPAKEESAAEDGEGNCAPEAGKACTIEVSAGAAATFWDASPNGSERPVQRRRPE